MGNPVQAILQRLMAQRGQPGMQTQAPQGGQGLGSAVSQQMAQLRGADPNMVVKTIEKIEKDIAALIPQTVQSVPGVAAALAGSLRGIQRAKKEAQQAQQTMSAMGSAPGPPIQFSPASPNMGPDNSNGPEMT